LLFRAVNLSFIHDPILGNWSPPGQNPAVARGKAEDTALAKRPAAAWLASVTQPDCGAPIWLGAPDRSHRTGPLPRPGRTERPWRAIPPPGTIGAPATGRPTIMRAPVRTAFTHRRGGEHPLPLPVPDREAGQSRKSEGKHLPPWRRPVGSGRFPPGRGPCPPAAPQHHYFFVIFVPSWWKIADVTKDTLSVRGSPTGQACMGRESAIFHHEGTKITKTPDRISVIAACSQG